MKERPILFSAPMVLAILAGTKTQTRRIVKPQGSTMDHPEILPDGKTPGWRTNVRHAHGPSTICTSPYGVPGDRLWVRETVHRVPPIYGEKDSAVYAADGAYATLDRWGWKAQYLPSIHMPRGLSRITLEVTGVRVERLQDISERDAKAEGCHPVPFCEMLRSGREHAEKFASLWDSINADRASWASNPWVWVVEFKRVKP